MSWPPGLSWRVVLRPQGGLAGAEPGQWRFGVGRDRGSSGWPGTTVRHDRSDPDPRGDRSGRPTGRRATAAAGLRRAAQAGRRRSWPRRSRGRRSRPRPWSTRRTCGCVESQTAPDTGTAAGTSSPPRPRPCAASSSTTPAASDGRSGAAIASDPARRCRGCAARSSSTSSWPSTRRCNSWPRPSRSRPGWSSSATSPASRARRRPKVLGISPATADRHWAYARAWLHRRVRGGIRGSERFLKISPMLRPIRPRFAL